MKRTWGQPVRTFFFLLLAAAAMEAGLAVAPAPAAPPLYWCPDRPPDQQYAATPEPGCTPLVEKEDKKKDAERKDRKPKARDPIKIENFQSAVGAFLRDYRAFLDCCTNNVESLDMIEELEDLASDLLKTAQTNLFSEQMKLRGFTLRELIPPVARARDELRVIKKRLERIGEAEETLPTLDFESAGRARRRIQEEEEAIKKEFRPTRPPEAPSTGMEIGVTPSMGPAIGTVPPTGTEIGTAPPTGLAIGVTPPTGKEIGQTPRTGFETGTTGRVGPAIGDSSLNRR